MSQEIRPRIDLSLYPRLAELLAEIPRNKWGTAIAQAAQTSLTITDRDNPKNRGLQDQESPKSAPCELTASSSDIDRGSAKPDEPERLHPSPCEDPKKVATAFLLSDDE